MNTPGRGVHLRSQGSGLAEAGATRFLISVGFFISNRSTGQKHNSLVSLVTHSSRA